MKKYFAEFLGTFVMVFCGTGAIIINQESGGAVTHLGVAITFGLVVSAMIYSFGGISGAHFNPAVTLSFCFSGKFPLREIFPYIISQISGAILASLTLHLLFPANQFLGTTIPSGSAFQSFTLEIILTFILMLVILQLVNGPEQNKSLSGWIIGAVVLLEALFAGPICGASMNPVRSLAPALVSGRTEHLWVYLTAPFIGALFSVFIWKASGFVSEKK
jgi:aquaporin NIP